MTAITPEQFMTLIEPDEEELEPFERDVLTEWSEEPPLASIAAALRRIETKLDQQGEGGVVDTLREAYDDLEAKHAELYALLEEVEALLKPSTSKLANSVRDAITRWRAPEVPVAPDSDLVVMPTHDAPVEEWRLYANTLGYIEPAVDLMNRSQIRTLLGIEQPA